MGVYISGVSRVQIKEVLSIMEQVKEYNKKEIIENWKLIVSVLLVSLLVIVRDIGVYSTPTSAFVMLFIVICTILPYKSLVSFFFFSIPFQAAIHGITVDILLVALLLKSKNINAFQIVFSIIILGLELFHLMGYSFSVDFMKFVVYAPNILLFFFILFEDRLDNHDIYNGIKYYAFGVAVISLAIIFHAVHEFGTAGLFLGNTRIGGDIEFETSAENQFTIMNANSLAYFVITAFSLLLYIGEAFNNKIIKYFLFFILLFTGVLTTSRSWLILVALISAIYFFTTKTKGKVGFIIMFLALFMVAKVYMDYSDNLLGRFEDRLLSEDMVSGGGRESIFKQYNDFFKSNPEYIVFGTGVIYYKQVTKIASSTHSGFQQLYVCYGIAGVILYLTCFIYYIKRYRNGIKFDLACYMTFFTCFVFDQTIQFLLPHFLMLPFVATMLPLKLKKSNKHLVLSQI